MKIILLEDINKLGKEGDLVDAKPGYARNYLFPRKMAVEATPENMENWKEMKAKEAADEQARVEKAQETKALLESKSIALTAKGGEGGKLFGAITTKDIAGKVEEVFGVKLDKKKIDLSDNIKTVGNHTVPVKLHGDINADLTVVVEAE
ncbi:large subunit ribosomal protein L9 [Peptoniphilus ivorii]|uniref:50S ribosomal protein L9 n=1 Tax=Aedoeadaptatus ivorii TaxID=54006 RepID=UPI002786615B|nr:50S ribosomal protein L9 [Peptoniphilus ivorii]MDQ0508858.1 large subunit ribosomal protein L9 [Peptoniphilus ivorii]